MAHERLAIVDPTSGKQPLFSSNGRYILAANGEIYNHKELRAQFEDAYDFQTASDCEIILALYEKKGPSFIDEMNGIFGFALYDTLKDEYFIARDHMGIIPLYMGWDHNGTFYVASELKALEGVCTKIELFPPGHYLVSGAQAPVQWYTRDWMDCDAVKHNQTSIEDLHDALAASVRRQLMSDVPWVVRRGTHDLCRTLRLRPWCPTAGSPRSASTIGPRHVYKLAYPAPRITRI